MVITFAFHALRRLSGPGLLLLAVLVFAGCGRDDIQVYRVAKDSSTPAPSAPMSRPSAGMPSAAPSIHFKLPAGWEEVTPGEMRAASFRVKGADGKLADVGVFPLPGLTAHDEEPVNLWRGELGLQPLSAEDVNKSVQSVTVAGLPGRMYEVVGVRPDSKEHGRIIAAIINRDGVPWFFKMAGDDNLVAAQKPAFVAFLNSVTIEAGGPGAMPPGHPPVASGDTSPTPAASASASAAGRPDWQVPTGWQETSGGQFLFTKFLLTGPNDAKAAINVSTMTGDGGGLAANINRWRGQLGLAPYSDSDLAQSVKPLEVASGKASIVDFSGTDARTSQKARVIGVVVTLGDQTWFYKLMGDVPVVDREQAAFTKFVQTANNLAAQPGP